MEFLWIFSVQYFFENYSLIETSIQFPCRKWVAEVRGNTGRQCCKAVSSACHIAVVQLENCVCLWKCCNLPRSECSESNCIEKVRKYWFIWERSNGYFISCFAHLFFQSLIIQVLLAWASLYLFPDTIYALLSLAQLLQCCMGLTGSSSYISCWFLAQTVWRLWRYRGAGRRIYYPVVVVFHSLS